MEYEAHRLRFGDWQPSPVRGISCDARGMRLAVGREDGSVEIFAYKDKIPSVPTLRFPGRTDFQLQSVQWGEGRLFGASLRGFVFEYCFQTLSTKSIRDTHGGAAWCMARNPRSALLAVGCEDGACRIFSFDGSLEYTKTMPTSGSRILCIAYHPLLPQLMYGCADGTIRCIDEASGRGVLRMTGDVSRGIDTRMHSLVVLSDSTVVSGDSRGNVQVWDGRLGVLTLTIHQHEAQVLCLAASADERAVFASGVDARVTCLRRAPANSDGEAGWVYTTSHRIHSHDVFALCVVPSSTPSSTPSPLADQHACPLTASLGPLLLSGGLDTKLCVYFVDDFAKYRPVTLYPTPPMGLVSASTDGRTLLLMHQSRLDLWTVDYVAKSDLDSYHETKRRKVEGSDASRCTLRATIRLRDDHSLVCCALSGRGDVVLASSASSTRMWRVVSDGAEGAAVSKVLLPVEAQSPCHALAFSVDDRCVAACTSRGLLLVLDLLDGRVVVRDSIDHRKRHASATRGLQEDGAAATLVAFNADTQWLVVGCASGLVCVYDVDRLVLHWTLPPGPALVTALAFHPSSSNVLAALYANNSFSLFNVDAQQVAEWSIANSEALPHSLRHVTDTLVQVQFDPSFSHVLFLRSLAHTVFVDLARPLPESPRVIEYSINSSARRSHVSKSKKEAKSEEETESNLCTVNKYTGVIGFLALEGAQLVVLENPWSQVLDRLPDTFARKRYGT